MTDVQVPPWPWWMTPARLIGRVRPGLLAAAQADAFVLAGLPRVTRTFVIPLVVFGIAAAFATLHAFSEITGAEQPFPLNWLRLHMDNIFTEVPLFLIAAGIIGVLSPAAGVLFVLSFGAFDFVAAAMQPEELHMSAIRPVPFVGRLVAYWLLWLLVVEVPVIGRLLASSVRSVAGSRLSVAALAGVVTGAFIFIWTQGAAILIRPVYLWSDIGGPQADGFAPLQIGGGVIALVVAITTAAAALLRGPSGLLYPVARPTPEGDESPGVVAFSVAIGRKLILAGLLTIGLGGMITVPLDAAVLFIALAGAAPLARVIAKRNPVGAAMDRLPSIVRVALAIPLVYGVSFLLIDAGWLKTISEFFPVIVVFAVGLFAIELVTARGSGRSDVPRSVARAAGLGAVLAIALLAIAAVAPMPVFADNGGSLSDLWATFDEAVFAGMATPILIWAANKARLPPEKPKWIPPPNDQLRERRDYDDWRYSPETKQWTLPPKAKPDNSP